MLIDPLNKKDSRNCFRNKMILLFAKEIIILHAMLKVDYNQQDHWVISGSSTKNSIIRKVFQLIMNIKAN